MTQSKFKIILIYCVFMAVFDMYHVCSMRVDMRVNNIFDVFASLSSKIFVNICLL